MPRLSSHIPKYSRHKQRNQAFVLLDGKQRMLGSFGSSESRQKYNRLISLWMGNDRCLPTGWKQLIGEPTFTKESNPNKKSSAKVIESSPPRETTVGEVLAAYVPFAKVYYKENRTYEQVVQLCRLLRQSHERTAVTQFGPEQLQQLRNAWVISGWGRKHTNDMIKRLVALFRWAAEKSASRKARLRVPLIVWQTLKTIRGLPKGRPLFTYEGDVIYGEDGEPIIPLEGRIPPPVDDRSVNRTLPHLPKIPADMVRFQQVTGCRPGEVCSLRPCDVDLSNEVWLYRPSKHKTMHVEDDDGRVVAIGKVAQEVLLPYLERNPTEFCFSPQDSEKLRRALLTQQRKTPRQQGNRPGSNRSKNPQRKPGKAYTVSAYNKAIGRAIEKANALATMEDSIEHWTANQLRKAYALKIRYQEGLGLDHSQVVLGHRQRATTERWYARNQANIKAIEVAQKMG